MSHLSTRIRELNDPDDPHDRLGSGHPEEETFVIGANVDPRRRETKDTNAKAKTPRQVHLDLNGFWSFTFFEQDLRRYAICQYEPHDNFCR